LYEYGPDTRMKERVGKEKGGVNKIGTPEKTDRDI
jgi:hypothetical protein